MVKAHGNGSQNDLALDLIFSLDSAGLSSMF